MILLHRIGPRYSSNFNTLEEIEASTGPLSFDGIYHELYGLYKNGSLAKLRGRDITFFVSGMHIGKDNSFDIGERPGIFCTWEQISELKDYFCARVGWHGWAHLRCVGLTEHELIDELMPPSEPPVKMAPILAWPHGVCDGRAIEIAKMLGFKEAYCAGPYGDGSEFQRRRHYLGW